MRAPNSGLLRTGRAAAAIHLHDGVLADVAPTLLAFAGLPRWPGMTGQSLLGAEMVAARAAGSG